MKTIRLLYLLIAIAIFCACSSDMSEEQTVGGIAGSVSDKTTGEPVATVNVSINPGGSSTVTGSDGTFSFYNLEPGSYTLTISKEGYKQNSSTVSVRIGDPTSAHLLIERIPAVVTADRELLDFGANESTNTLSFNIVNPGYVDLEWEIEERCDWITEVKPSKGTLKYGKTEAIVVVIDRELLPSGSNEAVIVVRSSNGSSEVKATAMGAERYAPQLNTLPVSEITSSSATLNGEIVTAGMPAYTERGFVYSTNPKPALDNTIAKLTCKVTSKDVFSYDIDELASNTTYYVRAYATNKNGTSYSSNEIKFTTDIPLPQVITVDVVNPDISAGKATFRGNVTFVGEPPYIERGFVFSTLPEPTINDNKIVANGSGQEGVYSIFATNLPTTTYYVRAYATSSDGTAYGQQKTVTDEWIEIPTAGIAVQREDIGFGDFDSVKSMCENSTIGGYTDWRLPTIDELMVLYNNREMIGGFFTDKSSLHHDYWSSYREGNDYYGISFASGGIFYTPQYFIARSARSVRTLK